MVALGKAAVRAILLDNRCVEFARKFMLIISCILVKMYCRFCIGLQHALNGIVGQKLTRIFARNGDIHLNR